MRCMNAWAAVLVVVERGYTHLLSTPEYVAALETLTGVERLLGGRLIRRQFAHGSRMERDLAKYGPEGTVKLGAARSIQAYMYLIVVAAVVLAATGEDLAATVAFALLLVVFVLFLGRCQSAARSGRQWRGRVEITRRPSRG